MRYAPKPSVYLKPIFTPTPLADALTVDKLYLLHYFAYSKNFRFEGETHDFWEMIYCDSGEAAIQDEETAYQLLQGQAFIHAPNHFHNVKPDHANTNVVVIGFGGELSDDTSDIGFSAGESYKGARILRQLASVMNFECTEDTITRNSYSRMAQGTYFATMTTPDVYSLFITEMVNAGYTEEYAKENIIVTSVPKLPVSGDLEDESQGFFDMTVMGGINGYAISSYTKYPNACLAFINFATSYKMIKTRCDMLAISPARSDIAFELGGLNEIINANLENGTIYVMPSVRALAQVWKPFQTFCASVADDVLRGNDLYATDEQLKQGLANVDKQIYDAIHTLAG